MPLQGVSLTMLLSDLNHAFCQSKCVVAVTTVELPQVPDASDHGLVVLVLVIESLGHIGEPLVQLLHAHPPHHQFAIPRAGI